MAPKGCWPAAYAGHEARSIEPTGEGVTEAGDGEAAADGVGVAAEARPDTLGVTEVDPDGLPHAASTRTATNADRLSTSIASVMTGPCCHVALG